LLGKLDLVFEVRIKEVPEEYPPHLGREQVAEFLAHHKADAYLADLAPEEVLITADTIVCLGERILNKPRDEAEAFQMLRLLSGQVHEVITGVCLLARHKKEVFHDLTRVHFKVLTDAEITHYVTTYRPLDKAGAYGAQEWLGMVGIDKIEGSYFNVMGLPVHKLYEELQRF
jgi:septum formation protein